MVLVNLLFSFHSLQVKYKHWVMSCYYYAIEHCKIPLIGSRKIRTKYSDMIGHFFGWKTHNQTDLPKNGWRKDFNGALAHEQQVLSVSQRWNSESEGVDNVYATNIPINTEVRLLIIIIIITYRRVYGAIWGPFHSPLRFTWTWHVVLI